MTTDTVLHRLHENKRLRPNAPAYYLKTGDHWVPTSWREYTDQVRQAAKALIALGVEPGGSVAILGFNRPEWVIMDLAGMFVGGTATGIYTTNSASEVKYITAHCEARVILLEDESQWKKVEEIWPEIDTLKHVVMYRGVDINDERVHSWEQFLAKGDGIEDSVIDGRLNSLDPHGLCTLIYTSGTTGPPKGVMLSHHSLAWTADVALSLFDIKPEDSSLSYLPLSHIAEQMFTIHGAISGGFQIYFAESGLKVADNIREVQPTIVFGVPRVWERFHAGVTARMKEATGVKAKIAAWAQTVGHDVSALRNRGEEPTGLLAFKYNIADKLVFSKVKPALGLGNARLLFSAAAPLNKEIMEFFSGLDLIIHEIYGQSEDCGPTTTNRPGATKFGTVGQPWPGTEVKIAGDGEILVKGPNVFMGYYKDEAATKDTLIDDWLYSGDLGQFDDDGFLTITGRKKEIIITSGGKNIAPKNIEAALKNLDMVSEAVVIGEQRRYLTALLTLEEGVAATFAEEHGLDVDTLYENPTLRAHMQKEIDEKVNSLFARVEHVRDFTILPRQFMEEHGELTPTMKIKRRNIDKNFKDHIEAMYAE
jgi:long-chain acyl-CoA synthetase